MENFDTMKTTTSSTPAQLNWVNNHSSGEIERSSTGLQTSLASLVEIPGICQSGFLVTRSKVRPQFSKWRSGQMIYTCWRISACCTDWLTYAVKPEDIIHTVSETWGPVVPFINPKGNSSFSGDTRYLQKKTWAEWFRTQRHQTTWSTTETFGMALYKQSKLFQYCKVKVLNVQNVEAG